MPLGRAAPFRRAARLVTAEGSVHMDRVARRAEYAEGLRLEALRRFGAERADALARAIEDLAGWMAEVAAFPVDPEEPPAFYAEPEP
jgi:hypothetical protein